MKIIELTKIYRQKDLQYIELLNAIRNNSISTEGLNHINQRHIAAFKLNAKDFYIYLAATNEQVITINETALNHIKGKNYKFQAKIQGEFTKEYYPAATLLEIKIGAQIMMLNNDSNQGWVNGDLGKVIKVIKDQKTQQEKIVVKLDNGRKCYVEPYTWSITKLVLENKELISIVIGTFSQYPIALAWVVTIHKSQGKTFDRVIIDLSKAFAHGQSYVALSRCTSLEGIILKQPLSKKQIWFDPTILNFLNNTTQAVTIKHSHNNKINLIQEAIKSQQNLRLLYKKTTGQVFGLVVKPCKIKTITNLSKPALGVVGYYWENNNQFRRLFFLDQILKISIMEAMPIVQTEIH